MSVWCRFVSDDLWNAVVCFQPPSLLMGKVWVPVMHFYACPKHYKVHWRVERMLGSYKFISAKHLIVSTISELSISSVLWELEVLRCLAILAHFLRNRSLHVMEDSCRSKLVNVLSGVQQDSVLGSLLFHLYTSELFHILENKLIGCAVNAILIAVCASIGVRVTVAESLGPDLVKVSEWFDSWVMKLNASKTKTMIV